MPEHTFSRRRLLQASAMTAGAIGMGVAGGSPTQASAAPRSNVGASPSSNPYGRWRNGPNPQNRADYFPLGVWLQDPTTAPRYQEIGINSFVGLYDGPTEGQLQTLSKYGMRTLCTQNEVGLLHRDDPTIMGWTQPDEPDNAQPGPNGTYGPPMSPLSIISAYRTMTAADPTRPVYLGLGQGVADGAWVGRGVPQPWDDYYDYVRGGDINSFDVYPVTSGYPLWYPAKGVDSLHSWGDRYAKIVWNVIETTNISSNIYPTPEQVRSEVWMSIIHGSRGIVYFCHSFVPTFDATGLLDEPAMRQAVSQLNKQIMALAPVLNSPDMPWLVDVTTSNAAAPVDTLVKAYGDTIYVLAACMRDATLDDKLALNDEGAPTVATFTLHGHVPPVAPISVLGENRDLKATDGRFSDTFTTYGIHLYAVKI